MNEIRDILLLSPCESSCVKFKRRQTDGGRGQNWGYILGKDWILTEKGNLGASREQGVVPCLDLAGGFMVQTHGIYILRMRTLDVFFSKSFLN